jgi:hypothetical protein
MLIYKSPKLKSSHWVGTVLLTSCQVIERPSKKDGFCFKLFHTLDQTIWAPRGPDKETLGMQKSYFGSFRKIQSSFSQAPSQRHCQRRISFFAPPAKQPASVGWTPSNCRCVVPHCLCVRLAPTRIRMDPPNRRHRMRPNGLRLTMKSILTSMVSKTFKISKFLVNKNENLSLLLKKFARTLC